MISQTEISKLKALKKCSVIQFKFSKMDLPASKKALEYLLTFLKGNEKKLLRLIGDKPKVTDLEKAFGVTLKLELLEDSAHLRKLQEFLVNFFTDDGVSNMKILESKS